MPMAARENQGLQIALIIFVVLTIVLIVSTYWFFSNYREAQDKMKALDDDNKAKAKQTAQANAESEQFKGMIGAAATDKVESVQENTKKDIERFGKGLPASEQNYRALVKALATELANANTRITEITAKEKELTEKVKNDEAAKNAEIAEYKNKLDEFEKDLMGQKEKFAKSLAAIETSKRDLAKSSAKTRQDFDDLTKKSSEQIGDLTNKIAKLEQIIKFNNDEKLRHAKANEVADGKIVWVNQRSRNVWINLGSADGLRPLTSFSVFVDNSTSIPIGKDADADAEAARSSAKGKGVIQVTRLIDSHMAEARIVEDNLSNPLMPGDNIFNTTWERGRAEHFALAGNIDIDQDGRDDRQQVRDLIALNGGVIDEEVDEDGKKSGEMSINTKYLIRGAAPKVVDGTKLSAWTEINKEAEVLGVKTIRLKDFLDYMGYQVEDRTVNLGRKANPNDFKPRLPHGVQPVIPTTPRDFRKPTPSGG
jgi:hypothetical protein